MKSIWRFFSSLKVFLLLGFLFMTLGAIGSVLISARPQALGEIEADILVKWLAQGWRQGINFWVYGFILSLFLIALGTFICSLDKLPGVLRQIKRVSVKDKYPALRWTVLAPYLAHLGFLLVLLGHLLSASSGFRTSQQALRPSVMAPVPHRAAFLRLEKFTPEFFKSGMPKQFKSEVSLYAADKTLIRKQEISVNHPLFYQGVACYQENFGEELDKLELNVRSATGERRLSLGERETLALAEGELTLKMFVPDYQGQGIGMAYVELATSSGLYGGPLYLVRGQNSRQLGPVKLTITDATSRYYTVLSINCDPGAPLVLGGAILMTLFALVTAAVDYRRFLI